MIAAWKSVDVSYGVCYAMLLMDESIFGDLFSTMQDGKSTWHLFTSDLAEIYHTGSETCSNPERLISESNSGTIFHDEKGHSVCSFSMTMSSPDWTIVREVSMEDYEQLIRRVRSTICVIGTVVLLIALALYRLWLKGFMRQFNLLLNGIIRMGEGDLAPAASDPFDINEFEIMQEEINRTSTALNQQMDTIRQMERERMEQENMIKEQEQLVKELRTARQIQRSVLPHIFPPFPDRLFTEACATAGDDWPAGTGGFTVPSAAEPLSGFSAEAVPAPSANSIPSAARSARSFLKCCRSRREFRRPSAAFL